MMASLAEGGSARRHREGRQLLPRAQAKPATSPPVRPPARRSRPGTTPVVFNWDYLNPPSYVGRVQLEGFRPARTPCSAATTPRPSTRARRTRRRPGCGRSSCTPRARDGGQNLWLAGWRPAGRDAGHDLQRQPSTSRPPPSCRRSAGTPLFLNRRARPQTLPTTWHELGQGRQLAREHRPSLPTTATGARPARGPGAGCALRPGSGPSRSSPTSRSSCSAHRHRVVDALQEPAAGWHCPASTPVQPGGPRLLHRLVGAVLLSRRWPGRCSARCWPTRSRPVTRTAPCAGSPGRLRRARPVRRRDPGFRVPSR